MPDRLPDSYESLFDRALTEIGRGNTQEAIDLVSRIVNRLSKLSSTTMARKPDRGVLFMDAWDLWIELLRWEKRFDEAIAICEQLAAQRPDLIVIQTRIWMLTIEVGETQAGVEGLRQLVEEHQNFEAQTILGVEYRYLKQYQHAESSLQAALSMAQSNEQAAIAQEELMLLYQEIERTEDMLEAWNMCVVFEPERIDGIIDGECRAKLLSLLLPRPQ